MVRIFDENEMEDFGNLGSDTIFGDLHKSIGSEIFYQENPISLRADSLKSLISGLKPSFLTREWHGDIRHIFWEKSSSPMAFVSKNDSTILLGSGIQKKHVFHSLCDTIPDIRLPFSAKNLDAWIVDRLSAEEIPHFLTLLLALDFPVVYAPESIITTLKKYSESDLRFSEQEYQELCYKKAHKIGEFLVKIDENFCLQISDENISFSYEIYNFSWCDTTKKPFSSEYIFSWDDQKGSYFLKNFQKNFSFFPGEVIRFLDDDGEMAIAKDTLRFSFDTIYVDGNQVLNASNFCFRDRQNLAENGIVVLCFRENFIQVELCWVVHSFESQKWHKKILKIVLEFLKKFPQNSENIQTELKNHLEQQLFLLLQKRPMIMIFGNIHTYDRKK